MNIFRFIADMLHLTAILVLLYRIKKSRNCIGKLYCSCPKVLYLLLSLFWLLTYTFDFRSILQDLGVVFARVLREVPRPLHVFHLHVQYSNENVLHWLHCFHHLPYEIQETLLHSKYYGNIYK